MSFSKDVAAGLLCIAIGAVFGLQAFFQLDVGAAGRMGPGYYPLLISGILIVLGLIVVVQGLGAERLTLGTISWRSILLVTLAPILFGISVRPLGLAAAIALTAITSTFASRQMGVLGAVLTTAILCAFCIFVFSLGLGLNLPILGTLFDS